MSISQQSYSHDATESEQEKQRPLTTPNLLHLFSLDLAHCPRFDRAEEYALACRTRAAWLALITSVQTHRALLLHHVGEQLLPVSSDTLSEGDILRLVYHVEAHVKQSNRHATQPPPASLQTWLTQMHAHLAHFRHCRDEMVHRNLRFVVMLARRYQQQGVSLLDLVQEGALGLMRAVEKFDPDRGVRFASYAVWWIREAFARTLACQQPTHSFSDAALEEKNDGSLIDLIAAPEEASPESTLQNADTTKQLHHALASLPAQEADILRLRFGIGKTRPYTLAEVSQQLHCTREQVRVREQRALVRLRMYLKRSTQTLQEKKPEPQRHRRKAA